MREPPLGKISLRIGNLIVFAPTRLKVHKQAVENSIYLKKVMTSQFDGKRFAIGKNAEALQIHALAPLSGILDDQSNPSEKWEGIPLVHPSDLPTDSGVVNCASCIAPLSSEQLVRRAVPSASVIPYNSLQLVMPDLLRPPSFVVEMKEDWERHESEWLELRASLADLESKTVFDDVVGFRRTGSYDYMSSYRVRLEEQYFDPICPLGSAEVFVDCGAFEGETTEYFIRRCPNYGCVWCFEPSQINMERAQNRLRGIRDIHFIAKGVSNQRGTASFDAKSGSASAIKDHGGSEIDLTTIDDEILGRVSFIKMDLEGWELNALNGARHHIQRDHPKLAIAVYHKPSDFRDIKRFIVGVRGDYDIYLRHYTEGWSETVMYFIPR